MLIDEITPVLFQGEPVDALFVLRMGTIDIFDEVRSWSEKPRGRMPINLQSCE